MSQLYQGAIFFSSIYFVLHGAKVKWNVASKLLVARLTSVGSDGDPIKKDNCMRLELSDSRVDIQ